MKRTVIMRCSLGGLLLAPSGQLRSAQPTAKRGCWLLTLPLEIRNCPSCSQRLFEIQFNRCYVNTYFQIKGGRVRLKLFDGDSGTCINAVPCAGWRNFRDFIWEITAESEFRICVEKFERMCERLGVEVEVATWRVGDTFSGKVWH